jgi:uncharacterized surface protein with fasciclin (FAS1) repeats
VCTGAGGAGSHNARDHLARDPSPPEERPVVRSPRAAAALAAGLALALGGCSSGDTESDAGSSAGTTASAPATSSAPPAEAAPEGPFGPGCAGVPASGPGSFADMAGAPVAVAASRNPLLSALTGAVGAAHLADSLNAQQEVTVLAPANAAFEAIPAPDRQALTADTPRLTALLTHHVIQGRVTPDRLAGTHATLNNDEVTIEGSGTTFTVAAAGTLTGQPATVICGNVPTANATVYIIDQVLSPAA